MSFNIAFKITHSGIRLTVTSQLGKEIVLIKILYVNTWCISESVDLGIVPVLHIALSRGLYMSKIMKDGS